MSMMQSDHGASIHLEIPFYRQHFEFTCGPACLIMAMKYLEPAMRPGKELEIDLWREANLVAVCGTSRYGIAFSAAGRGFSARVTSNTGGLDFVDRFDPPLDDEAMDLLRSQFSERRTRCRNRGVREKRETITAGTIRAALFSNHAPLIVTGSRSHGTGDLPHWVIVTGIDDKFLYFNDPADSRPGKRKIGLAAVPEFIGFRGAQSMVEIWKA
jgi:hypothetical protein